MAKGFRRILVPHDFSIHADRAVAAAVALAGRPLRLTVLHVASPVALQRGFPPIVTGRTPTKEALAHLEEQLRRRVTRVVGRARGPRPSYRVVVGDPHREILRAARGADLIVMGTLGLGGLSHLLVGSVAEKVVRHSPVPVLTVRARTRR